MAYTACNCTPGSCCSGSSRSAGLEADGWVHSHDDSDPKGVACGYLKDGVFQKMGMAVVDGTEQFNQATLDEMAAAAAAAAAAEATAAAEEAAIDAIKTKVGNNEALSAAEQNNLDRWKLGLPLVLE